MNVLKPNTSFADRIIFAVAGNLNAKILKRLFSSNLTFKVPLCALRMILQSNQVEQTFSALALPSFGFESR